MFIKTAGLSYLSLRIFDQRIISTSLLQRGIFALIHWRCLLMSSSLEKWPACLLGRLSLFAENNLRVLANRFEWHPATVLFVYSVRLSLPELPACLCLGLWVTHLQPPQQSYCRGRFRHWKCWRLENGRNAAGESGHYIPLLDISLLLQFPTDISITVPTGCLWLTLSCDWHWKFLQPLALRQWKQPVSGCCVSVTHSSMRAYCKRTIRDA